MLKKILWVLLLLFVFVLAAGAWLWQLLDHRAENSALAQIQPGQVPYLQQSQAALLGSAAATLPSRGKVLAVVSSTASYPLARTDGTLKKTGYELTELSRFYWVLQANGFVVDIASPQGGHAPMVLDDGLNEYDYAFLNDPTAQQKFANTLALASVNPADYQAVYFVGGKGTMFDFIDNSEIGRLLTHFISDNKLILAVCHGPAALLSLPAAQQFWLSGKQLTAFTNDEELALMPDAASRFGGLLQDKLSAAGSHFQAGPRYLPKIVQDGQLISGQNPWSVWLLAEAAVQRLGVTPKARPQTREERSMQLMLTYQTHGLAAARAQLPDVLQQGELDRNLPVMLALVAVLANDWQQVWPLLRLADAIKQAQAHPQLR